MHARAAGAVRSIGQISDPAAFARAEAELVLLSVVDARPAHDAVRWRGEPISRAWSASGAYHHRIHGFTRSMRPRDGTSLLGLAATRARSGTASGTDWPPQRNCVSSSHMRCSATASLRASATLAFFIPGGVATRMAQALGSIRAPRG